MQLKVNIAAQINYHHQTARQQADEAIRHAEEAGKLLMEVKAALPHGEFGPWLDANVLVSQRQAQRYMAVAQGKPVPVRALGSKNDTVSYLEDATKPTTDWPAPKWQPAANTWYSARWDKASFWVVPSTHEGFFHVSKLHQDATAKPDPDQPDWDGESLFDGSKRPMRADVVEQFLWTLGMSEPEKIDWEMLDKPGIDRPFCEPEQQSRKPEKS